MKRSECAALLYEIVGDKREAAAEASLLFATLSTRPVSAAAIDPDSADAGIDEARLRRVLRGRKDRVPLAYLLGEAWFYRECYEVTPDCLIPRSDTEVLVDFAVQRLPRGAHFVDVCTGCGCVAVSVLRARPDCTADALDISEAVLRVAARNAERWGVSDRVSFLRADALSFCPPSPYDAALANPPYIPSAVVDTLAPEVRAEPRAALDGGADGLDFYRAFCRFSSKYIYKSGFFAAEIGFDQGPALSALASESGLSISLLPDLGGRDRVAVLSRSAHPSPVSRIR
ncbi:MAG: peptide chain release factor N(5)-glutamine methyltransferase [Clostridia bacterium]|nr:peptide chain release factor N(5)-glutamine methyltransferase [Clostridia bacterium]